MTDSIDRPSSEKIAKAAQRSDIPISDEHAQLVAKTSDSLLDAIEVVRSLNYQDHEPSNVFNPVVISDGSEEGKDQ